MTVDTLYLLQPAFANPDAGEGLYFCKDCATIDGLLAMNPAAAERVAIKRIPYARPRADVIAVAGESNQNLPLLVFGEDEGDPGELAEADHGGRKLATSLNGILDALTARQGFPRRNP